MSQWDLLTYSAAPGVFLQRCSKSGSEMGRLNSYMNCWRSFVSYGCWRTLFLDGQVEQYLALVAVARGSSKLSCCQRTAADPYVCRWRSWCFLIQPSIKIIHGLSYIRWYCSHFGCFVRQIATLGCCFIVAYSFRAKAVELWNSCRSDLVCHQGQCLLLHRLHAVFWHRVCALGWRYRWQVHHQQLPASPSRSISRSSAAMKSYHCELSSLSQSPQAHPLCPRLALWRPQPAPARKASCWSSAGSGSGCWSDTSGSAYYYWSGSGQRYLTRPYWPFVARVHTLDGSPSSNSARWIVALISKMVDWAPSD